MKRLLIAIAACLLAASPAFAATDSESLTISATVGDVLDVQLIDDSATGLAENLSYIGMIRILSNDPTGFSLTITSQESGVLLRSGGTETIDYSVYLTEEAGALGPDTPGNLPLSEAAAAQLTAPLICDFNTNVSPTDVSYSVNIQLSSFVGMNSGDYEDVLTFDLADSR